jgi:hypothetical protein
VAVVGSGWIRTGCGSPPACTMDADTVAGRKVHITFGAFALIVDDTQIVKECET